MPSSADENIGLSAFLTDRPKFKLYVAQQHLNSLKSLEARHVSIVSAKAVLAAEIEMDGFLLQVVSAVDSLLAEINEKLDLGLPINLVDFAHVQSALSAKTKKIDLLSELDSARQHGMWFWELTELRNYSIHGPLIPRLAVVRDSYQTRVYFRKKPADPIDSQPMELEVIPYFEQCLSKVEALIEKVKNTDPLFT